MIYDGANAYLHVADVWTGFFLGDREGPRIVNDPLWPLDALFGARDAIEIGSAAVRGIATARYRAMIDLARADAALPAGITVPAVPFRAISQIPAEVWLDSAGRSRRIAVMTEPAASAEQLPVWSIVELWDFGVAAEITVTQPEEVLPPRQAFQEKPPIA
jgi:hypothetical protein